MNIEGTIVVAIWKVDSSFILITICKNSWGNILLWERILLFWHLKFPPSLSPYSPPFFFQIQEILLILTDKFIHSEINEFLNNIFLFQGKKHEEVKKLLSKIFNFQNDNEINKSFSFPELLFQMKLRDRFQKNCLGKILLQSP